MNNFRIYPLGVKGQINFSLNKKNNIFILILCFNRFEIFFNFKVLQKETAL